MHRIRTKLDWTTRQREKELTFVWSCYMLTVRVRSQTPRIGCQRRYANLKKIRRDEYSASHSQPPAAAICPRQAAMLLRPTLLMLWSK